MKARSVQYNHRLIFSCAYGAISLAALISAFGSDLYDRPAQIVFIATAMLIWSTALIASNSFANHIVQRFATVAISQLLIVTMISTSTSTNPAVLLLAFTCAGLTIAVGSTQHEEYFAYATLAATIATLAASLIIYSNELGIQLATVLVLALFVTGFFIIRNVYLPVVVSLNEAIERAEIFSTITKSSREFHSREPEEAIKNIINVTKTLGYISVSVVSFDRRQKIFEDGVPIPNLMDIAVKASATRRVTIVEDDSQAKNPRARHGDIVGVPIWINGRYSAALIVQTSSFTKVTQRDCEALELLADQAGRALENAGKAAMDRRVVERLTDESQRDKLTGLGNRRFADAMVASLKPGDVVGMIDLDGLKSTNDIHGHQAGDELLIEVGKFLTEQIRNPDLCARLGGDEFMVLLRNASEGAEAILERLVRTWEAKHFYETTFSVGMAIHRQDKTTRETVELADKAMYEAKRAGKNRLVRFTAESQV